MQYGILSFACNMIFMSSFFVADSILGLVDSCATVIHITEFRHFLRCLGFLCFWSNGFAIASCSRRSLSWHSRGHGRFQFPCRILNDVLVVFITRINRINFTQTSGILEFWLFERPFLFFFSLSGLPKSCPRFRPYVIWTCRRLSFCQSHPGPHISFWRCIFR